MKYFVQVDTTKVKTINYVCRSKYRYKILKMNNEKRIIDHKEWQGIRYSNNYDTLLTKKE